ncbi:hypothetical protein Ngar_c31200 [Candidatus Nitrososphaera gargensis Ga9.2]|uniref:Uncharacterized protein n=1 Tax=Nitrososphaera gargensis (strain Ga9.2) TaxID=1237085 RepID=K0IF92_NITGG|nr:hypothetical protein Ngar_c31200 [Candidatus Nitrososphaera gargensis Ga9.2]
MFELSKNISADRSNNFKKEEGLYPLQQFNKTARRKQQVWQAQKDNFLSKASSKSKLGSACIHA